MCKSLAYSGRGLGPAHLCKLFTQLTRSYSETSLFAVTVVAKELSPELCYNNRVANF